MCISAILWLLKMSDVIGSNIKAFEFTMENVLSFLHKVQQMLIIFILL
mgnify:CR=1 FL=1